MDGSSNLNSNLDKSHQRRRIKSNFGTTDMNDNNNNNDGIRKMMHRDIERQRRQEMAALCASLRSLLPLEYIKGKRAISEHVNGAVNYIKDLQKRIEDMSVKRDKLKKISGSGSSVFDPDICSSSSSNSFPSYVIARPCLTGVEVVISTSTHGVQALRLSKVIEMLLQEGLDVVSCVSTKVDGGLIHTIQSEVSDLTCIDLAELQQKLNGEIP